MAPLVPGAGGIPFERLAGQSRVAGPPYCPCMMLWPISMLSKIFDTASSAVPAIHAGGRIPANSKPRRRPPWCVAS